MRLPHLCDILVHSAILTAGDGVELSAIVTWFALSCSFPTGRLIHSQNWGPRTLIKAS